ncbi:MAG: DUF368 domain-containing protein [Actinomycetota bacterium]|nr:DUF368 domain-containing protein [Actinomycetota bacterium]
MAKDVTVQDPSNNPTRHSARDLLGTAVRGACMGAADVVPGVSGGTVALVAGIYDRLVGAAHDGARVLGRLLRGDLRGTLAGVRSFPWSFAVPLLAGMLAAVALLAGVIEDALAEHSEPMAGLFLGLVAASALVVHRDVAWTMRRLAIAVAVGAALFTALGWQGPPVHDPSPWALFGGGMVAACAMVLPGISGSFLLLMLGLYAAAIEVVDGRMLADAAVLATGAVVGLACFSSLLVRLLARWPHDVMAAMVGLLAGSLRVLWPWPDGVGVVSRHAGDVVSGTSLGWPDSTGDLLAPALLALLAAGLLLGVERVARSRSAA